jgi:hypothetical protein
MDRHLARPRSPAAPPTAPRRAAAWAVALAASPLVAADARADEHATAIAAGAGGAATADPIDLSSVRANPSAFALQRRYDLGVLGRFGPGSDTRWGAIVVDAKTNDVIAFAFRYAGNITRPPFLDAELPPFAITGDALENRKQQHDFLVAVAIRGLDDRLSFGVAGDVLWYKKDWGGEGVTGNLSLGGAAKPHPNLTVGLSARDLIPQAATPDRPTLLTLGVRGGRDDLKLGVVGAGELTWRPVEGEGIPLQARLGVQGLIRVVGLRAGWWYDGFTAAPDGGGTHHATWGFGLYSAAGSLDYAMDIPATSSLTAGQLTHGLSLTLHTDKMFDDDRDGRERRGDSGLRWQR